MTRLVSTSGRESNSAGAALDLSRPGVAPEGPAEAVPPTQALLQSEARLRALLSSLDDLVFELDAEGRYLAVWTDDESLLADSRQNLLGHTLLEALGDGVGSELMSCIGRVLATGTPEAWLPAARQYQRRPSLPA